MEFADVLWEYILDDDFDESEDDDDNTLPTVSTRETVETEEDALIPMTLIKDQWMKATKGISDFAQTHVIEQRDEGGSNRLSWPQPQRKPDSREKNESRKLKWGGFGGKSQIASKAKRDEQKVTNESILDRASQAATAISTGVKEVRWDEAGDVLIGIFDVVQSGGIGKSLGTGIYSAELQSLSDSSSGDSKSEGYSYNSIEDESISHYDARVDKSAARAFGRHKRDAIRQENQKKANRSIVNNQKSASTGGTGTHAKEAGHEKDTFGNAFRNSTNNDGPNQISRKFACFAKIENNELDVIHQLDDTDSKFFFPAARMVSDLDGEIPISIQMHTENGLLGIPPDKFLGTKGPQSVYSYEYQSKIHMDVAYTKFGRDPNECISLRQFESVPALRPEGGNKVLIQVEASTISLRDCRIRQGKYKSEFGNVPLTPGVDVVGKVIGISQSISSSFSLYPGQSVLSLVQVGGNSRYISLHPESLVKVPEGIDPAQAVCLCDAYLSAFQSLHYGQVAFSRYAENSLEGKTVLIIGSIASTFGKAVVELAVDGNAAIVFATAKRKHWRMLLALGIIPLPDDSSEWLNRVEGTIDLALVVGMEKPNQVAEFHERALRQGGRLIICGCEAPKKTAQGSNKRFVFHDVYDGWEKELELSKRDIQHLIGLLEKEKLRPKVLDRLPLAKVADAQSLIESKGALSGFLVCEPWMETKKRALYL